MSGIASNDARESEHLSVQRKVKLGLKEFLLAAYIHHAIYSYFTFNKGGVFVSKQSLMIHDDTALSLHDMIMG